MYGTGWTDDRLVLPLAQGRSARVPWRAEGGAQNESEQGKTGQNGQNGLVLPSPWTPTPLHEGGRETQNENAPLLPSDRPPTASERARLRELYAALGSKEKVYMAAWGSKNGKVHSWLTDALAEVTATGDIEARITSPLTRESITVYAQRAQEE